MNFKRILAAFFLSLSVTVTLQAAAAPWEEKYYNPVTAEGDVIFPMPCEGAMVFRKIVVPLADPLDDYPIYVGQDNTGWGYVEQSRPAFVAGSFTEGKPASARYYLLAKYEMTQLQYSALMGEKCPAPANKLRLPQTSVSWFEAMQASNTYNLWLRKNALEKLPVEDGVPGFLRLPTEIEWEYAARGGLETGVAAFRDSTYPIPEGLRDYEWFAGVLSASGKLQLAGLLKPNPVGLHDILGNAAEMMFEPFHLNKLDRMHGQAGGYVIRGGSYLVAQADIRTAARKEEPYYDQTGETRSKSTGFRLAVVSTTLTSRDRVANIDSSWKKLGVGTPSADGSQDKAAVQQLEDLASGVEDKELKDKLKLLESQLRASNQEQEEARDQAIRASLNLGAFLCTKLKDDGLNLAFLQKNYKINCESDGQDDVCSMRKKRLDEQTDRVHKLGNYYANGLVGSGALYGRELLAKQVPVMKETFARSKQLQGLKPYLSQYWQHQERYLKTGRIEVDSWLADCSAVQN